MRPGPGLGPRSGPEPQAASLYGEESNPPSSPAPAGTAVPCIDWRIAPSSWPPGGTGGPRGTPGDAPKGAPGEAGISYGQSASSSGPWLISRYVHEARRPAAVWPAAEPARHGLPARGPVSRKLRASEDGGAAAWPLRAVSVLDPHMENQAISVSLRMPAITSASRGPHEAVPAQSGAAHDGGGPGGPGRRPRQAAQLARSRSHAPGRGSEVVGSGDRAAEDRAGPSAVPAAADDADTGPSSLLREQPGAPSAGSAGKLAKWPGSAGRNGCLSRRQGPA